ncbi:hypothetical protein RND81_13G075000 [Saponaria officinalis]|uniref:Uncharacterized protein n=1 Tax=Saponaria officinalis TaxID=3572 RepID=A0AAW1H0M0_SAPOF
MGQIHSAEMSVKLAKLGLAAVLGYGLFDRVTYTSFTGNNPVAKIQALVGIVIMMWTVNNVTRPFQVAGAVKALNFPSIVYAFTLVAGIVAMSCLTVIGPLILSRWGK